MTKTLIQRERVSVTRTLFILVSVLVLATACGGQDSGGGSGSGESGESPNENTATGDQKYPDIQDAELESEGGGTYTISVTVSSPYDSPERYADAWRVMEPDGTVLGERELMHDHANEQPFTRSLSGLEIPEGTEEITIEGHDLENGYGGETKTISVGG